MRQRRSPITTLALRAATAGAGPTGPTSYWTARCHLTPGDAAARAAKAVLLPDAKAAEQAGKVLDGLNRKALDAGLQLILNELGEAIDVDGAAGPATLGILTARAEAEGLEPGGDTPRDRLMLAARLYWQARPTRPDLY